MKKRNLKKLNRKTDFFKNISDFLKQNGSRPDFFQNRTDRDRIFFKTKRIENGSFSENNGSRPDLFQNTTDRDRIFFKKQRIETGSFSKTTGSEKRICPNSPDSDRIFDTGSKNGFFEKSVFSKKVRSGFHPGGWGYHDMDGR